MTTISFLRRFLLPTILLGAVVAVLSWEPSPTPPHWQAQVASSSPAAGSADLAITDMHEVFGTTDAPFMIKSDQTTIEYMITSRNSGPDAAVGTTLTLTFPQGLTFDPVNSGDGSGTCTQNGQTIVCTTAVASTILATEGLIANIRFSIASPIDCGATLQATAHISATTPDPTPGNNDASVTQTKFCPSSSSSSQVPTSSVSSVSVTQSSSAVSQQSSVAASSQASSVAPFQSSSSAGSVPNGSVIGLEAGLCAQVKPDPVTGQKLVYCCLDEGFIYQREATQQEFEQFVSLLKRIESMSAKDAKPIFDAPYDGSVHRKYGWTSLCGKQIPCDVCSQDHICGNGVVEATEKCDDGPRNSDETPDVCRLDCTMPKCGDSVIDRQSGEECDDGKFNGNQPNRCRTDCKLPYCGDGIIDSLSGETCDSGKGNSDTLANSCRNNCQSPRCGDNVKDSNEECDDGNRGDGDGCNFYCEIEQPRQSSSVPVATIRCGNGITEPGEECDTGSNNANVPNSCRQNCVLPRCGDRIQDSGEECDDGNNANGDGCTAQCTRELVLSLTNVCGNQIIDPGEECDAGSGNANIPDHCRFDCRFPYCGDGIKDTNEQCDDRNHQEGDGCTQDCFSEFCGDGFKEMGEECDDGNLISGDGCSRLCQKDTGTPVSALVIQSGSLALRGSKPPLRGAASSKASLASSKASAAPQQSSAESVNQKASLTSSSFSSALSVGGQTFSVTSVPSQAFSAGLNAQVIPFPTAGGSPAPVPVSTYYYPQQPVFTASSLNDTGPAALSIVAMGAAAGLAWARRKRRI